jgi:hypothetical protein
MYVFLQSGQCTFSSPPEKSAFAVPHMHLGQTMNPICLASVFYFVGFAPDFDCWKLVAFPPITHNPVHVSESGIFIEATFRFEVKRFPFFARQITLL